MLFKGNLMGKDKRAVYEELCAGMRELFGEKYELLMVEDPDATEDDSRGGPRVAFLLPPKEKVFGANSFWVTEMVPDGALEDGMLFKGNLRGKDKRAVYEELCAGMRELFGEKYELLMVEDPD